MGSVALVNWGIFRVLYRQSWQFTHKGQSAVPHWYNEHWADVRPAHNHDKNRQMNRLTGGLFQSKCLHTAVDVRDQA